MDQVEPEPAEEELFGEAGLGPLGFSRRFSDVAGVLL
jgi:hypothetical protein